MSCEHNTFAKFQNNPELVCTSCLTSHVVETKSSDVKKRKYTDKLGRVHDYTHDYELDRMIELDNNIAVRKWTRSPFVIKSSPVDCFVPNFLVEYCNSEVEIEKMFYNTDSNEDYLRLKAGIARAEQESRETYKKQGCLFTVRQHSLDIKFPPPILAKYVNDYGVFLRPIEETIFMNMALTAAQRSTCLRKKVGAVFTDSEMQRVLCFGYNGNVAKGPNQCDSLEEGSCGCIHAEINALTKNETTLENSQCFVTLSPCFQCAKILINRGISRVVYHEDYRDNAGLKLLETFNVEVEKYSDIAEMHQKDRSL